MLYPEVYKVTRVLGFHLTITRVVLVKIKQPHTLTNYYKYI